MEILQMGLYEKQIRLELHNWQKKMLKKPSLINRTTKRVQDKMYDLIPKRIQSGITRGIKEMVRSVLFGAKLFTKAPVEGRSLQSREAVILEKINFYKKAAAAEGGITGAGGFLLAFADFPILLGMKIKLLYEIANQYGYSVKEYKERIYILYIFQLAFSGKQFRREVYSKIANWNVENTDFPGDIHQFDWESFQREYRDYIDIAKLGQFIPVVGAPIGAMVNYQLIEKLGETAMNAYRMRLFSTTNSHSPILRVNKD